MILSDIWMLFLRMKLIVLQVVGTKLFLLCSLCELKVFRGHVKILYA